MNVKTIEIIDNRSDIDIVTNSTTIYVGNVDRGGVVEKDQFIIYLAENSDSTLFYTGEPLTGIAYANTIDITSNSKTLAYDVDDLLETTTHVFNYQAQTWTVTTTFSYTSGKLTGKSTTVGKV